MKLNEQYPLFEHELQALAIVAGLHSPSDKRWVAITTDYLRVSGYVTANILTEKGQNALRAHGLGGRAT